MVSKINSPCCGLQASPMIFCKYPNWLLYPLEAHGENFGVNALRGKLLQLGSPNLQDIFIGGISFSGTEISLILKSKIVTLGIFLKIIYLFYWLVLIGRRLNLFIGDMYNRYSCPLQHCRHLTLKLLIQGHPRSAKVPHIVDFKSAYNSLIIGLSGLQCETSL